MEVCGSTLTARKRDKGEKVQAGIELIWRHLCVKAASTGRYSIWKLYKRQGVSTTMRSLTGYECPDFSESSNTSLTIVSRRPFFPILTYSLENSGNRLDEERMLYVSTLGFLGAIEWRYL
uniref:Uncharacterized protein n=1 Tax=Vespula pensylvanica TaxID=30213 RepID=A0A834UCC1_VESPE|nr:hypothetical protein H0235_004254 [Vespula pensylvanica]